MKIKKKELYKIFCKVCQVRISSGKTVNECLAEGPCDDLIQFKKQVKKQTKKTNKPEITDKDLRWNIPWEKYPGYNYAAQDKNGFVYVFVTLPYFHRTLEAWYVDAVEYARIDYFELNKNYKTLIVKRPEKEKQLHVKSAKDIIELAGQMGATFSVESGVARFEFPFKDKKWGSCFTKGMFSYCGKPKPTVYMWHPLWLEER